jgi:hypothetical protein
MPDDNNRVVLFSANSTATLTSSTAPIQTRITSAILNLNENTPETKKVPETGHYVTRLEDAKVVWRSSDDGIEVLTIFSDKP